MYVAVDLETTGLEPEVDAILELGIGIYDDSFNLIDTYQSLVRSSIPDIMRKMPPFVLNMHTTNGLIAELSSLETKRISMIEAEAIAFLEKYEAKGLPLTGSTISFDRGFLKKYARNLEASFHYRNIDVSSFKIIAENLGFGKPPAGAKLHRVLSDVQDTMDDLQWFITNVVRERDDAGAPA